MGLGMHGKCGESLSPHRSPHIPGSFGNNKNTCKPTALLITINYVEALKPTYLKYVHSQTLELCRFLNVALYSLVIEHMIMNLSPFPVENVPFGVISTKEKVCSDYLQLSRVILIQKRRSHARQLSSMIPLSTFRSSKNAVPSPPSTAIPSR